MPTFNVVDMTCGGCAAALTQAIRQLDTEAVVTADLVTKTVSVNSRFPVANIADAITAAGYRVAA